MKVPRKHYPKIIGLSIVLLYLVTRLYKILAIPIFTDEAIYIRWTQIFVTDIHQFFIPLTDGKQPLFVWLGYPILRVVDNPLFGLRLVSVLAGLGTLVGIYLLTKELFTDKRTALFATMLYVLYPFSLVYDKLALYDGLLAMFAVWVLYLEVLLVRRRNGLVALVLAVMAGGALLTKSSALFFLYLIPASLLLFDFKTKGWKRDFWKWAALVALAVAGAIACYSILRFSPNYHYIADKNYLFIDPPGVWVKHPFLNFMGNLQTLTRILIGYTTLTFLFLVALAFFIDRRFLKEKLLLLVWFAVPFTGLVFLGNPRFLYPRYILFMTMPLLILVAYTLTASLRKIKPFYLGVAAIVLLMLPALYKDYYLLTNFSKAPIPSVDRNQLIAGYAAGVGVKETAEFLREKSKDQKIYVGTEGVFGLMPEGLQAYLNDDKNVEVVGVWPITSQPPQALMEAAKIKPTYFVFYAPCEACDKAGVAPKSWPLRQIFQIKKLDPDTYYTFYEVTPQ